MKYFLLYLDQNLCWQVYNVSYSCLKSARASANVLLKGCAAVKVCKEYEEHCNNSVRMLKEWS